MPAIQIWLTIFVSWLASGPSSVAARHRRITGRAVSKCLITADHDCRARHFPRLPGRLKPVHRENPLSISQPGRLSPAPLQPTLWCGRPAAYRHHTRQHSLLAVNHRTKIVVITDTNEYDLRAFRSLPWSFPGCPDIDRSRLPPWLWFLL